MKKYTESFLKTKLHCSYLPSIGGDITLLDKTQVLFLSCLKDLQLLLIKNELKSLDEDLFKIIKDNIFNYFPNNLKDDNQALTNYVINGIYSYMNMFPLSKYYPLIIDYNPSVILKDKVIDLKIDLLLKQNNKSNYLHAVSFVSKVDSFTTTLDDFNYLKLNFLSRNFTGNRNDQPATRLHLISIPALTYRNKNIKNYPLRKKTLTEKDLNGISFTDFNLMLNAALSMPVKQIPTCKNLSCLKRKECIN